MFQPDMFSIQRHWSIDVYHRAMLISYQYLCQDGCASVHIQ